MEEKMWKTVFGIRPSDQCFILFGFGQEFSFRCIPIKLITLKLIKGVIGCNMHFYKLFELKCGLAVCVHNHPIMIFINLVK